MTKPKITITIDGATGAGKTTLAHYLAWHLQTLHGVPVKIIDDGRTQIPSSDYAELPNYFDAEVTINVEQK